MWSTKVVRVESQRRGPDSNRQGGAPKKASSTKEMISRKQKEKGSEVRRGERDEGRSTKTNGMEKDIFHDLTGVSAPGRRIRRKEKKEGINTSTTRGVGGRGEIEEFSSKVSGGVIGHGQPLRPLGQFVNGRGALKERNHMQQEGRKLSDLDEEGGLFRRLGDIYQKEKGRRDGGISGKGGRVGTTGQPSKQELPKRTLPEGEFGK